MTQISAGTSLPRKAAARSVHAPAVEQVQSGSNIELFSPAGQLLRRIDVLENTLEIEMGSLSPGIYLLKVSDQNGAAAYRIAKQ